ncbi:unnamed protein product, partial [Chrysoparadoxa australica]
MVQLSWDETKAIMEELESLYSDGSDVNEVKKVVALKERLRGITSQQQLEGKTIIKDMTARVAQLERDRTAPSQQAFEAMASELEQQKASASQALTNMEGEVQATEREVEVLAKQVGEVDLMIQNTVENHIADMPRVQNAVSLYANISNIRWNYDTDSDVLAGWVTCPENGTLRAFSLDLTQEDKFTTANKLWGMMEGE